MKSAFTEKLLDWNKTTNKREMPWKGEKDPYKIWLSEIILQQTRVEQGLAYYNRFIASFPTINDLANAPEQQVFKLWEGLGYYSRCKNLIATAKYISGHLHGVFPSTYEEIRSLKGVGPYTTAAIASFAYNLPYAVVDGNVLRVLSRYFGIDTPIDSNTGKKLYNNLAAELLATDRAALYNQAIMDFGAIVCKAQQPLCTTCVQRDVCIAYKNDLVKSLPIKEKILKKKTRWFYYFIVEYKDRLYLRKRNSKDIWENLYEFVLQESDSQLVNDDSLKATFESVSGVRQFKINTISEIFRQKLTHQTIIGQFINVSINEPALIANGYEPVLKNDLSKYPFPKIISNWLAQNKVI